MRFFVKSGIIEVGNAYPDLDYPEYHKIIYYTFFLKKKKKTSNTDTVAQNTALHCKWKACILRATYVQN